MKRLFTSLLSLLLFSAILFTFTACTSYNGIKKNFTENGYTAIESENEGEEEENATAATIIAEVDGLEISCTAHLFKKDGAIGGLVMVLEFGAKGDIDKVLDEENGSATLRGLIKDSQKVDYINGNCLLVPLTLLYAEEAIEIFKK